MSLNPVFVMVFAGNCSHCKDFKKKSLEELRKSLKSYPGVTPIEYNINTIGEDLPSDAPEDLKRFVKFYPFFLLVSGAVWNEAKNGGKLRNVLLYGATITPDEKIVILPHKLTKDSLMEWVRNNVEHDVNLKSTSSSKQESQSSSSSAAEAKMIPTEGSVCSFKILSKR